MAAECIFCGPVNEYVNLANSFSQDLSETLLVAVTALFASLTGLWLSIAGIQIILGKLDGLKFAHEFSYLIIAAGLLNAQGADMANTIYRASLATMSGAAAMVLTVGPLADQTEPAADTPPETTSSGIDNLDGMTMLVYTAEKGIRVMLDVAGNLWSENTEGKFLAVILALPYCILLILYTAQVLISIFRVLMLSLFSPLLMMAVGFGFLRPLMVSGLQTLLASFLVLFASTAALAVCLYGVATLGMGDPVNGPDISDMADFNSIKTWVIIIMGWVGFAFQTEGTSLANSIARSALTNQASAAIAKGVSGTALAAAASPWKGGKALYKGGKSAYKGGKAVVGAAQWTVNTLNSRGRSASERLDTPGIDTGK